MTHNPTHEGITAPARFVAIPANLDVAETIAGPFTARQCAILASFALAAFAEADILHKAAHLPPAAVAACATPLLLAALILALAKPGGIPADRLLAAAIRFLRTGRAQAAAPADRPLPTGVTRLAPLYRHITEHDGTGIAELDGQRTAAVIEARPLCLQLADHTEVRTALAAIGQILAAQTGPFTLSTLTERISLDQHAAQVAAIAQRLTAPELAALAARQAAHLREIAEEHDLWHRRFLITLHEVGSGAATRAAHRAHAAAGLLDACGMPSRVLDAGELTALLTAACDPQRTAAPRRLAPPHRTVTAVPLLAEAANNNEENEPCLAPQARLESRSTPARS